jgi:8-oxo-dGTP pyrophosphatase MutT (NUDIX family)
MLFELLAPDDRRLSPGSDLAETRAQVEGCVTAGPGQEQVRDTMLRFIDEHPDALLRSCMDGHFTGSALVVDAPAERVLVLFHRKAQRWLQPGGHADGDANLAHVAWREATEETGMDGLRVATPAIDLDIHRVHFTGEHAHLHLDVRHLVIAPHGAEPTGNHESEALRWVTPDELLTLDVDAGTLRMARAGLAAIRSAWGSTA